MNRDGSKRERSKISLGIMRERRAIITLALATVLSLGSGVAVPFLPPRRTQARRMSGLNYNRSQYTYTIAESSEKARSIMIMAVGERKGRAQS